MGIVRVLVGLGLKKAAAAAAGTELNVKKCGLVFSQSKTEISRYRDESHKGRSNSAFQLTNIGLLLNQN